MPGEPGREVRDVPALFHRGMTQSVPCSQTPDGFRTGIERGKLEAKGN